MLLFAFAGIVGYIVDAALLLLVYPWMGAYAGRLVSFTCAVSTTWLINRSLAFREQRGGRTIYSEFFLYFLSMISGGAVNIMCYVLILNFFSVPVSGLPVAVAAGSLTGMLVNFMLSRRFVFTGNSENGELR